MVKKNTSASDANFESLLTTIERNMVKKKIRISLVNEIFEELNEQIHKEAKRIVKKEFADITKDPVAMKEMRAKFRNELDKKVIELAGSLKVDTSFDVY